MNRIASRIYVLLKDAGYCMYPNDVNYIFVQKSYSLQIVWYIDARAHTEGCTMPCMSMTKGLVVRVRRCVPFSIRYCWRHIVRKYSGIPRHSQMIWSQSRKSSCGRLAKNLPTWQCDKALRLSRAILPHPQERTIFKMRGVFTMAARARVAQRCANVAEQNIRMIE